MANTDKQSRIQAAGAQLAIKRDAYHRAVNGLQAACVDLDRAEAEWRAACQGGGKIVSGSGIDCGEGSEDGN